MINAHRSGCPAIVTRATPADAAEILALQKLAYAGEAAIYDDFSIPPLVQTEDEMRADIEEQVVLKAVTSGRIVGSVRACEREGTCYIGRLIVHPEVQNRGLGSRLLAQIEGSFPSARRFELFTGHRSVRNLYLYAKHGYVVVRTELVDESLSLVYLSKG